MHHPTDRITHTMAFVTPVVEHWLEQEEILLERNKLIILFLPSDNILSTSRFLSTPRSGVNMSRSSLLGVSLILSVDESPSPSMETPEAKKQNDLIFI